MLDRRSIGALALVSALLTSVTGLAAPDASQLPDLSGQWLAVRLGVGGQPAFDPTKPWGLGQQAPLKPEYQKILEASIADQANGGQGNWHTGALCLPPGMPAMMTAFQPMEIIVKPNVTYILIDHGGSEAHRRVFTDGRDWPKDIEPTFVGYSIGKWIDEDGDGKFDVLEVETRHLKGPRALDPAGMPTHVDNQSIVKERIYRSKTDPALLYDQITLVDNAFTQPWTVLKTYRRDPDPHPYWPEYICSAESVLIKIGDEQYFKAADGNLMPTRKDQPPPDFRYFNKAQR
jgi:hypothetical protein